MLGGLECGAWMCTPLYVGCDLGLHKTCQMWYTKPESSFKPGQKGLVKIQAGTGCGGFAHLSPPVPTKQTASRCPQRKVLMARDN